MEVFYSIEKTVQLIIGMLKAHGIKKVIASPGSTNICLVASMQSDPYFEMYSSVDERSAAYLACGMACESGEPVVLTCTEATASRNYFSGLTEAYYRKLPVLAITATNARTLVGQNHPQMIDRSVVSKDVVKKNLYLPVITRNKEWVGYENLLNDAILELTRDGGGPVHIEYETEYSRDYTVQELPEVNVVKRFTIEDVLPPVPTGKVAILVGAHKKWGEKLKNAVELFCEKYNAVVLADHISNYHGKYGVNPTIATSQSQYTPDCCVIDLLIYIGDISSSYRKNYKIRETWRVNSDGELRNVFGNLSSVFAMSELAFFSKLNSAKKTDKNSTTYFAEWENEIQKLYNRVPEIPFSNLYCASQAGTLLPDGAALFLGIENTLRSWNFFSTPAKVDVYCNTGGFGIDGGVSSLIGASLVNSNKLYFGVTGDLAFFYDMNVLANRHVGKNIRLMVINNGLGQQFKNPGHPATAAFGGVQNTFSNEFIAAFGHNGNKSSNLLKHYAEDLGFKYISARNKKEFKAVLSEFVANSFDQSVVFEVFTDSGDESKALETMQTLEVSTANAAKGMVKKMLGDKGIKAVKSIVKR